MKKIITAAALLFLLQNTALAQDSGDKIEADRPSNSLSTSIVKKNKLLTEIGLEREVEDNAVFYLSPRTYLRYGLAKNIELRLLTEIATTKDLETKVVKAGLLPMQLGTKIKLADEQQNAPAIAVLIATDIPYAASPNLRNTHWAPEADLLFEKKPAEKFTLDFNLGAKWNGEDARPSCNYFTTLNYEISDKSEAFTEVYGSFKKGNIPGHNVGAGYAYFYTNTLKFDIGFSKDLVDKKVWYVALGASFFIK